MGFCRLFSVAFTWFVEIFSGVVLSCLGFFGRVWSWIFVDFFLLVLLQRGLLRSLKNWFSGVFTWFVGFGDIFFLVLLRCL